MSSLDPVQELVVDLPSSIASHSLITLRQAYFQQLIDRCVARCGKNANLIAEEAQRAGQKKRLSVRYDDEHHRWMIRPATAEDGELLGEVAILLQSEKSPKSGSPPPIPQAPQPVGTAGFIPPPGVHPPKPPSFPGPPADAKMSPGGSVITGSNH